MGMRFRVHQTKKIFYLLLCFALIILILPNSSSLVFAQENLSPTPNLSTEINGTVSETQNPLEPSLPTNEPVLTSIPNLAVEPTLTETAVPSSEPGSMETPIATQTPPDPGETHILPTETPSEPPRITEEPEVLPSDAFSWELSVKVSPEQIAALGSSEFNSFNKLADSGVIHTVQEDTLKLYGTNSIDQMRKAIFNDISPVVDFLGRPIEVVVNSLSNENQEMEVNLNVRLSTGFLWNVNIQDERETYSQIGDSEFALQVPGKSLSSIQAIRVTQINDQPGVLILNYRQPFNPHTETATKLVITLPMPVPVLEITNPNPPIDDIKNDNSNAPQDENPIEELVVAAAMPTSFDWRNYGVVPAVKYQGGCGSCWAFSTVGVMESAIKITGGPLEDLSEQFLVSCNKSGSSCNGGYLAHPYHFNTLGKNQTQIGAVLESSFPYTESDSSCGIYTHPYKLNSWKFITSGLTIPTVDQIKNAIYTYGPVTAGVCVGPAFNSYNGGVFSTNENVKECDGHINHMVILTGWDDATQTWILRNSWDTWWGESGYMRIKWGTSRVGEGASWVKYGAGLAIPAAPGLVTPANAYTTNNSAISFQWNSVSNGINYQIEIDDVNTFSSPIVSSTLGNGVLNYSISTLTPGTWYWHVRAINMGHPGAWSTARSFTIDKTPPSAPALSSPANLAAIRGTPTFSWAAAATANAYQFVYDNDSNFSSPSYTSPVLTTTKYVPPTITPGTYYWHVRARDASENWSAWSASRSITILPLIPSAPALTSPASSLYTNDNTPSFSWSSVAYGASYEIQIDNLSSFASPIDLTATTSGLTYTATTLTDGKKYWKVRAININGERGAWSSSRSFTVDTIAQAIPAPTSPSNGSTVLTTIPTLKIGTVSGAKSYQFQVDDASTFTIPLLVDVTKTSTSYTLAKDQALPFGTIYWRVRSIDAAGNMSAWSTSRNFIVNIIKTPANLSYTTNTKPSFTWAAASGALEYHIQIDNSTAFTSPEMDVYRPASTSYTPSSALPFNLYNYRMQVRTAAGWGNWTPVYTFTVTPPLPSAPVLVAPASKAITNDNTPTLSWNSVTNGVKYQVQISKTSSFSSIEQDQTLGSGVLTYTATTLPDGIHYWRARAINYLNIPGAWSSVRSFTVDTIAQAIPAPTSPSNGSTVLTTIPTLKIGTVSGAKSYQFQVDDASTFTTPLLVDVTKTSTSYTLAKDQALPFGTIYWRVRSIDAAGNMSAWSTSRNFIVNIIKTPANLSYTTNTKPSFTWAAASGALEYHIQIDNSTAFTSPEMDVYRPASTSYTPSTALPFNLYNYRMQVRTAAGWGNWTPVYTFTVTPPLPSAPVLVAPASKAITNDNTPTLSWNSVTNGVKYQVQISKTSSFSSIEQDQTLGSGVLTYTATTLPDGIHYWRARAINYLNISGAWSSSRSFTVDTTP